MTQVAPNPSPAIEAPIPVPPPPAAAPANFAGLVGEMTKRNPHIVAVKLDRHYRPAGEVEIVGHWTPRKEVRNAKTGKMEVLAEAEFHKGEPMPSPLAGVGTASGKLWAGTVARFPVDEAKAMRSAGIGTIEIDDY